MKSFVCRLPAVIFGLLSITFSQADPIPQPPPPHDAPPPAASAEFAPATTQRIPHPMGNNFYSIGQPTDEEQLYLEYINRSRANPTAEGVRLATTTDPDVLSAYSYFSVNLVQMQAEFSTNIAVPPLAMNSRLLAAARGHSDDMFLYQYQGHTGSDGSTPGTRIAAQGYNVFSWGENVYATAKSVWYGHAGLNVDWGPFAAGMQPGRGHRVNMHYAGFREIGVGVVNGVNGGVGPQLVTQDFGTQQSATPFITGVVYYDFNGNNFYDIGEGLGGVTVNSAGSTYYTVTADSGGYALPVSGNGNYTVTFSASALSTQRIASVTSQRNVKLDYLLAYTPPLISGPNPAGVNQSNTYTFSSVGGAISYQWEQSQLGPYTYVEGAESGLANVTTNTSAGYSALISDVKYSGSFALHLCHPASVDQYLTLNAAVRAATNSQLSFYKRLGWASAAQIARAQVSTNDGANWDNVWTQPGTTTSGDLSFSQVTVSLAGYAGQLLRLRFVYDYVSGGYYNQTSSDVGLCLDNIAFSNVTQALNPVTNNVTGSNSFVFCPTNSGNYSLRARAQVSGRTLPWGPTFAVSAIAPPPSIQIINPPSRSGNQILVEFNVLNHRSGMTFQLWKASTLNSTWALDTSATLQVLIPNSKFRLTTSTAGASTSFYRVRGNY